MILHVSESLIKAKKLKNEKIYLTDLVDNGDMKFSDLYNTVFNKSVTGIGGTSLALDSKENIIILMPFKEVVNNKEGYNEDTFTVKAGVTVAQIAKYLKTAETRKIVSTYDGLEKIFNAFIKAGIDIADDFLMVDEWQVLFSQYTFRNPVMKYLLSKLKDFNKVCLMTATPIRKEWWFDEIKHLEELTLEYNLPPVEVRHYKCRNIKDETVAVINLHAEDRNLHFFCNSVDFIKDVLKAGDIKPEDVRIICAADSDKNKVKLTGYKIETTKDAVKKINFYTSTCFEGCDIKDEKGKIFVLCNGLKAHTLIDISTTLPQIAGRIRDIKDGSIDLIYSESRYTDVSKDDFEESITKNKARAKEILKTWEANKDVLSVDKLNCYYLGVDVHKEGDKEIITNIEFDETLLNLEHYNYEINNTYSIKANLISEISENFVPVTIIKPWAEQLKELEREKIRRMTFKEKILSYIEQTEAVFSFITEYDKVVIDAVNILGAARIESLNYHKGDIQKALIAKSDISESNKIMKLLIKNDLKSGVTVSNEVIKAILTTIYSALGIKKAPAATQIKLYFDTLPVDRVTVDGRFKGYKIIRPLTIFN